MLCARLRGLKRLAPASMLALLLVAPATAPADSLLATDGFHNTDYASSQVLDRSPFIPGFTGAWHGTTSSSTQIGSTSLTLAPYTTASGGGTVTAGNRRFEVSSSTRIGRLLYGGHDGPLRQFASGGRIAASSEGRPLYIAFLARTTNVAALAAVSLCDGGIEDSNRRLRIAWVSESVSLVAGPSGPSASIGPRSDAVELFILAIVFGNDGHTARVWRNPSLGATEPAPDATLTGDFGFDRLSLTFSGSGSFQLDELRLGDSWTAVTGADRVSSYNPLPPVGDPTLANPPAAASDGMEVFPPSWRPDGLYDTGFYPFIDRYGQYRHLTWADKVRDDDDLARRTAEEQTELATLQPPGFGRFGGWKHGPRLEATGFFRRAKVNGKWWLVDPEGYLFFSSGVTTVSSVVRTDASGQAAMRTGITGREHFFEELPPIGHPARFLGLLANETATVTSGDYQGQRPLAANFFGFNALKQFPETATSLEALRSRTSTLAFDRLRSWGFTTIGGWSDPDIFVRPGRRPYTNVLIYTHPGLINGSTTYLDYFRDAFVTNLRARLQEEVGKTIGDPWNLGYYIDNERDWTKSNVSARTLGLAVLASPAEALERYAKRAFRDQLQAKYGTIATLNAQWGVSYASWDDFLTRRDVAPAAGGSDADMNAFERLYAETYFRICRDIMREIAPQHLYLGCRFTTGGRDALVKLSEEYADVTTVNIYGATVHSSSFLDRLGSDGPVMSTEFHFFSYDSGLFAASVSTSSLRATQALRGAAMRNYLESALNDARFVGAHWFQYFDYPTSGRLNSRNMNSNLGLVGTTNLPYTDMVQAARAFHYRMYRQRFAPGTRQPQADAHALQSSPATNFGTATSLAVGPGAEADLRFSLTDVSSVIERAVLWLAPVSGDSLVQHALLAVDNTSWSEGTLSWNQRPTALPGELGRWTTRPGLAVEVDVTRQVREALLANRQLAFRIVTTDGSRIDYGSRESSSELRPQLLLITSPNTLASWKERYFIAGSGASANTADPDRDGLPNLLEYALALSPNDPDPHPGWKVGLDGSGRPTFTFHRARSEITYVVEGSSDLVNWLPMATNPGTAGSAVTVTDPTPGATRFFRLRVTAP